MAVSVIGEGNWSTQRKLPHGLVSFTNNTDCHDIAEIYNVADSGIRYHNHNQSSHVVVFSGYSSFLHQ